jgi:hypothetical protein
MPMDISSIGGGYSPLQSVYAGDNEAAERVPDNEAAEASPQAKAPLPAYAGTKIDVEA